MKKMFKKIFSKKPKEQLSNRITTETVAEHREKILAGGRKYKYPIQYAKHKLVINTIIICFVFLVIVCVIGWHRLFIAQSTSDFIYSVTKVLPIPIAKVDGEMVFYSNYLMEYRGFVYFYQNKELLNLNSEDGKRQLDILKRQTLDGAIADAYAKKIAKEMNISVSDDEVDESLELQRKVGDTKISEQTYSASTLKYFGWNSSEYEALLQRRLLKQKVSYAMDTEAEDLANKIFVDLSESATDFSSLADSYKLENGSRVSFGKSGWVPKNNQDGGLSQVAVNLEKNQISNVIQSTNGDGYCIIKLIDSSNNQISYEYIKISLSAFNKSLDEARESGKIKEYIDLDS